MTEQEMTALLDRLIANWEDEVVEFKSGNKNFATDEIGR